MSAPPVAAIGAIARTEPPETMPVTQAPPAAPGAHVSFSQMFLDGVDVVSQKTSAADAMVKSFILDDSIPPHRVIYALEQSQLALQMMLQVRNRLVEGYQDIMRMQL